MEQLDIILNKMIREFGIEIFNNAQRFKSAFSDYSKGEFLGERELLIKIIEIGAYNTIINAEDISITKKILVEKLHNQYFLDEKVCSYLIEIFASILRRDNKNIGKLETTIGYPENINVNNDFDIKGQMALGDFVQFNKVIVKRNIFTIKTILPWIIGIGASIFLLVIGAIEIGIIFLIFDFTFLPIQYAVMTSKNICKKSYNANSMNKEEQNFIINKDLIKIIAESTTVNINKNQINKLIYDDDSIYIMIGINQGFIIKDRYCKNIGEFNNLKSYLENNFR
jgi:hypothetical protein